MCSSRVFHSPQEGHRPIHLGNVAPQFVQMYWTFVLAIGSMVYRPACRAGSRASPRRPFVPENAVVQTSEVRETSEVWKVS